MDITPALIGVLGSIGVGTMTIGAAMMLKVFKGPVEQNADLASAIRAVSEKVDSVNDDHAELAQQVAVLANEVGHLATNVKGLGEEVKNWWRGSGGRNMRSFE